jgi:hypothetical protein
MSTTHTMQFEVERNLGEWYAVDVTVEYTATPFYPATWDDPAEGGEIEIVAAWTDDAADFSWTADQEARWREVIEQTHDFDDDGFDPDRAYEERRDRMMESW